LDGVVGIGKDTAIIIQARMGSTRLPGKCMRLLGRQTVLSQVIDRCVQTADKKRVCVATTVKDEDDVLAEEAQKNGVKIYRGSSENVLERYCGASVMMKADHIVRVTADNPFTEPRFIRAVAGRIREVGSDYAAMRDVPYGTNAEAVTSEALHRSLVRADEEEKEHVTLYIRRNPGSFRLSMIEPPRGLARPDIRLTLDTPSDHERLRGIFTHFGAESSLDMRLEKVLEYVSHERGSNDQNRA
jgi:spore coat polysaccharide biosynthesis protein SpsF